jgi:hypothetical protein
LRRFVLVMDAMHHASRIDSSADDEMRNDG